VNYPFIWEFMSNIDIVPALKAEITQLEADIIFNPDPRVRKLQRLREALAEYEPAQGKLPLPNQHQANGNGSIPAAAIHASTETKAARMKSFIQGSLHANTKVHRKSLLDGLIAAGIMGKEKNPMQALAIFLSGSEEYESDGAGNYSIKGT
jgi:hypothetical protein